MEKTVQQVTEGKNGKADIRSPWIAAWFHPAEVNLRYKVTADNNFMHRLMIAWGSSTIAALLIKDWSAGAEPPHPLGVLTMMLLAGPFFGMLFSYLLAAAIRGTGRWMKGKAENEQMQVAIAWTWLPVILGNISYIVVYLAAGESLPPGLQWILFLPLVIGALWTLINRVAITRSAMNIGLGGAIFAVITGTLFTAIPPTAISILYYLVLKGTLKIE